MLPPPQEKEEINMFVALMIIIGMLFLFNYLFPSNMPAPKKEEAIQIVETNAIPKEEAPKSVFLNVNNDFIQGKIDLTTGSLVALDLKKYHETAKKDSQEINLLAPKNFTTYLSWKASQNVQVPTLNTLWQAENNELTPTQPLILTFQSQDLKITRKISVDEKYLFHITDTVQNLKTTPIAVAQIGKIQKNALTETNNSTVFTGLFGVFNNKLEEAKFLSLNKEKKFSTNQGWLGITEKYWQTIFVWDENLKEVETSFDKKENMYVSLFQTKPITLAPQNTTSHTTLLFAGPKDLKLINAYEKEYNIPKFDLSIDFGWFYFLTKPFLGLLNWLYACVGNMGIAILLLATLIKIALLPIATKSYNSMAQMKKLQPKMKE